jgi:hypothetical protein
MSQRGSGYERKALDANGELRNRVTMRVPQYMRDGRSNPRLSDMQRSVVADAANRRPVYEAFGHPAGHRPGAVFTNDQAARDTKAAVYRQYDEEIGRAWQQTNPRRKSAAATCAGEHGQGGGDWPACPDCNGHDATCSTWNGRGFISRDDARDDAIFEAAFQQTQTYHAPRRHDA